MTLTLMLSWVFPLALLVRDVLYEKENRLREVNIEQKSLAILEHAELMKYVPRCSS